MSIGKPPGARPAHSCPECLDSGFVIVRREGREFARRCRCTQRARRARLFEAVHIPERHSLCSFESFETRQDPRGSLRGALDRARRFAEAYPVVERGLLFMGPSGVGKTHLGVAVLRALVLDKGIPALFIDYSELLKRIQDTYSGESAHTEMDVLRPVLETEVVLLDDLGGARAPSPWTFDVLFLVLNTRYNRRLHTLLTTNFLDEPSPGDSHAWPSDSRDSLTSRIGARIRSRLHEMCDPVVMDGPDFRVHRAP